jgi:hypothetical protein
MATRITNSYNTSYPDRLARQHFNFCKALR